MVALSTKEVILQKEMRLSVTQAESQRPLVRNPEVLKRSKYASCANMRGWHCDSQCMFLRN